MMNELSLASKPIKCNLMNGNDLIKSMICSFFSFFALFQVEKKNKVSNCNIYSKLDDFDHKSS